jgi:hypothetical protein
MGAVLTREETQELIKLCHQGRLYEIENWIVAGKPIQTAPEVKKTLLSVAIKTGFHSLIELLALYATQAAKNQGLADAVSQKRLDLVELFVARGAEIRAIPFSTVLLCWDPHIIRFFLDNGADVITGAPFAVAFGEKIRTALRPFLEWKQRHPELTSALQEQADRALRTFAYEGDLKWVSLLMWAGANPRSRGPKMKDEYNRSSDEAEDDYTTALEEACHQENLDVLKRLKPDAKRDNLTQLLNCASLFARKEIIGYLLEIGAQPNDKLNGGSTAMDKCLQHLGFEDIDTFLSQRQVSRWGVHRTMQSLGELMKHGATWKPDGARQMDSIRRTLYRADPELTVDVIELFVKNRCCAEETLQHLIRTPRMRQHFGLCEKKLRRLGLDLRSPQEKAEQAKVEAAQRLSTRRDYYSSRYNRDQLYEEIWVEPVRIVAKKYGLSNTGLAKACRILKIPRPGLGYWAKKAAGKQLGKRPLLPPLQNLSS